MPIKITMPSPPQSVDRARLAEALVDVLSIVKVGDQLVDFERESIVVKIDGRAGATKGELIWQLIQEIVADGEYRDRNWIAREVSCTVSRVAEVLKAHQGNPTARRYRLMAEEARMAKYAVEPPSDDSPAEELELEEGTGGEDDADGGN